MKVLLRDDESGVSEVVGTILILAITVVLFSTIIIWVSNIPTPTAQTRLDLQATLSPVYAANGTEIGVNITLLHNGGESLSPVSTVIYIQDLKSSGVPKTDILKLSLWHNAAAPNGLLDGKDTTWNIGERWAYSNNTMRSADKITVTIVDTSKGTVLFNSQLTPPAGTRPPVFLNIWATQVPAIQTIVPLQSGGPIYILAQVQSPDNDLNPNSVFASLTMFYGTGDSCAQPQQMNDNGVNGDQVAHDGIFTLWRTCINSASISWDGALVLLNATDLKGHQTTTRFTLHITPGTGSGSNTGGGAGSGRPPNLRWNGNQGYNLFNASQWDQLGYAATATRTFKESETVVMVVGSLTLENTFGINSFNLLDPYSGQPAQSVVYGSNKAVGQGSIPSSTQAFGFFQFVNGYYVYTYRFTLNTQAQTNYYVTPPSHPPYYYFASYPLSVLLTSSSGNRFSTTDSINITSNSGQLRTFPKVQTFSDPGFTTKTSLFNSTAMMYVQVQMLTVNNNDSSMLGTVVFGNIMIQDFAGGLQLNRAPTSGINSNLPICPAAGSCSSSSRAIWSVPLANVYRFAINLARVNQDPWVAGNQNYALVLSSVKDSDESYSYASISVMIKAPLYKMDIVTGNTEGTNSAWGTKDYAYFYQDYNGFDLWKKLRVDYCYGGTSISGVAGSGSTCPKSSNVQVAFGDFWHDGTLGVAESFQATSGYAVEIYRKGVDATGAVVYLPVFNNVPATACTAIATGDVTGNGLPSVICGGANGRVWYYANNGNWTQVTVDTPASGQTITGIAVGDFNGDGWNDIAVAGLNGYVKYYPNLGYGRFQNGGISDNWFPAGEVIVNGTIASGSYLNTFVKDGSYEQLQEAILNQPLQTGATVNGAMNNSAQNWTFAPAYNTATGTAPSSGGFPGSFAQVTTSFKANSVVAGYWYQPFTVSGSQPFSASLSLSYEITANGASGGGSVAMYAFVDSTCSVPPNPPTSANYVWTSGAITGTPGWTTVSGINVGSKITTAPGSAPTTFCLKVAMYATYAGSGLSSTGGFDNVGLTWSSTPGPTSALKEYWRIGPLPTRPGTAFTFNLIGHESGGATGPDYDNFTLSYSTNVSGNDPTTGTYTTMFTVTGSTDVNYAFAMPNSVSGATVWIKARDTNRVVGDTNLDNLYVDQMYINANTPSGTTGATLTGPSSNVNSIDSQDRNKDGYSDLVAGTAGGRVYEWLGSAGGLTPNPTTPLFYNGGTPVVGVAFGNFSTAYPGLQVAVAYGTTVAIIRADTGGVINAALPAFSPSSAITAFAIGDINGDGWDDCVIGTSGGNLFLWENLGQGTSWTYAVGVDSLGAPIYSIALGDSENSQYVGR